MKRIRIIRKKVFCLAYKVCAVAVCLYAVWIVLRIAGQVFLFASFSIPSDSMVPVLRPGDYVLVDKPLKGARIFDVWVFYDLCKHFMFFNIHSHAACVFVLPHGCCV